MISRHRGQSLTRLMVLLALAFSGGAIGWRVSATFDITTTSVSTVSAASFELTPVSPDSIVAAFGTQLATQTVIASDADPNLPGIQLPTELGGTTVEVNGKRAGLFFVSPGQVNYVVPGETTTGTANVVVKAGDNTTSSGTLQVTQVAPAIFTANSNGRGVAAASLLRIKPDGAQSYESISQYSQSAGRFITKPIDLGPEGERVFLVLFLSGVRNASDPNSDGNLNESVRLLIGGNEITPLYAGRQPDFVGLDQINVEIPRSLSGRGIINVSISATGFASSNLTEIEIAGSGGSAPPQVSSFGASSALAGQTLIINGTGFSANPADNIVRISGLDAQVMSASSNQLVVMVPFGAETGTVSVRTTQGEGVSTSVLPVRTSISGFVENTLRQPMSGVTVKVSGSAITTTTSAEGSFVLADVPPGVQFVEVDGGSLQTDPPYPMVTLKIGAQANRDNQFSHPIALQQATGSGATIGGGSFGGGGAEAAIVDQAPKTRTEITIQTGDFQLELPDNIKARFPNGSSSGEIFLTPLENARTPVDLPFGYYSSDIVQITPFNVQLEPGGKLTFPNTDGFPAGATATLFRYDTQEGKFVREQTPATVSADGLRIETSSNAVKVTSYYFAAVERQTTTITGRVFEKDGKTPVVRALARYRGQEALTDGNGSYILRFVPVKNNEIISVDISLQRPSGRVDRVQSAGVAVAPGGITKVPDVLMPGDKENRPPTILTLAKLQIDEGKQYNFRFTVTDPDANQTVEVKIEGATFASVTKVALPALNTYTLRLSPTFLDSGEYRLIMTATDSAGGVARQEIRLIVNNVNRPPTARDQTVAINEDESVSIRLDGSDPDGDRLRFSIVTQPSHGALTGFPPLVTYQPADNFNGTDQFTFRTDDGTLNSSTATVSITIRPVNDPPVLAVRGAQNVLEGQTLRFAVSASDPDQGQTLTFSTVENLPAGATLTRVTATSAEFAWTPDLSQSGQYKLTFRVTDNGSPQLADLKDVQITVLDLVRDLVKEPAPFSIFGAAGPLPQTIGDEGDQLGQSIAAGDLNGDAIPDLVASAPAANGSGFNNGRVFVFFGKAGLDGSIDLARQNADVTFTGEAADDRFGSSLAIGDLNGDGKNDLIIGAPLADVGERPNAGKVYAVFGGLVPGTYDIAKVADLTILGGQRSDRFGASLATGFVHTKNGPAVDLIAGAPGFDVLSPLAVLTDAGAIYGFFGGLELQKTIDLANSTGNFMITGASANAQIGVSLAVGNFNGDEFADLAIGALSSGAEAKSNGAAYLITGSSALAGVADLVKAAAISLSGKDEADLFGASLALSDINDDGLADLIIGAPGGDGPDNSRSNAGEVYVIYGAAGLLNRQPDLIISGVGRSGDEFPDMAGFSLAVGDFTGDGINDLAIGAPGASGVDSGSRPAGAVFLIFGARTAKTGSIDLSEKTADLTVYGLDPGDNLGAGGIAIADLNDSEIGDLILGIPSGWSIGNTRVNAGEVRVLWGVKRE